VKALEYLLNINKHMSAYAIIVDCLNEGVEKFYSKYGFEILEYKANRPRMFIPMRVVEQLF